MKAQALLDSDLVARESPLYVLAITAKRRLWPSARQLSANPKARRTTPSGSSHRVDAFQLGEAVTLALHSLPASRRVPPTV